MKRIVPVLCFVALCCARAEAHEISEAYSACIQKAAGMTFAMQDCISDELVQQDKRLNAAYGVLMKSPKVSEKRRAQLRDVQRKWIAFRDANCAYYYDPSGGQMDRLAANECILTATQARATELENLRPEG
jgi:uncharacterized protein YecT (DUF1311 family)